MREYTPEMARAAVERGAAWLDQHCPDWLNRVDLEALDLDNAVVCVLGQTGTCITGAEGATYYDVLRTLGHTERWAIRRGFCAPPPHGWDDYDVEETTRFEVLTLSWREYIRERLTVTLAHIDKVATM